MKQRCSFCTLENAGRLKRLKHFWFSVPFKKGTSFNAAPDSPVSEPLPGTLLKTRSGTRAAISSGLVALSCQTFFWNKVQLADCIVRGLFVLLTQLRVNILICCSLLPSAHWFGLLVCFCGWVHFKSHYSFFHLPSVSVWCTVVMHHNEASIYWWIKRNYLWRTSTGVTIVKLCLKSGYLKEQD